MPVRSCPLLMGLKAETKEIKRHENDVSGLIRDTITSTEGIHNRMPLIHFASQFSAVNYAFA